MLSFKQWLVSTINADITLQSYLKDSNGNMNVFPTDVDIQPEQFPAITYGDVSNVVLSVPKGMHIAVIQLNIWSTTSALEVESIYDRLQTVLNFQSTLTASVSISGTLWWLRENGARDFHTASRRIWHKAIDLKYWCSKTDAT